MGILDLLGMWTCPTILHGGGGDSRCWFACSDGAVATRHLFQTIEGGPRHVSWGACAELDAQHIAAAWILAIGFLVACIIGVQSYSPAQPRPSPPPLFLPPVPGMQLLFIQVDETHETACHNP